MDAKKAIANYNMGFNNGKFIKDKIYHYRFDPADAARVLVTTEEGTEQDLGRLEKVRFLRVQQITRHLLQLGHRPAKPHD